jgi:hypothetical protein
VSPVPAGVLRFAWTGGLMGALAAACIGRSAGHGDDFIQDYLGAKLLLAGEAPYQDMATIRARFGLPPTLYPLPRNPHPPLAILLAVPVAGLPFGPALLAYQVAQIAALAWTWGAACRTFGRDGWGAATLGGLLGAWTPAWQGLDWGQPVGFIAATALLLWRAARAPAGPGRAGAALALACCLRPFYVGFVATAARWPRRSVVLATVTAAATALALFGVVRLSIPGWLRTGAEVGEIYVPQCGSVPGLLGWTGLTGMWGYAVVICAVGGARWRGASVDGCAAAVMVFGLISYPLAWFHYDVQLVPVLVWFAVTAHRRQKSVPLFLAALYVALRSVPNVQGYVVEQQWLQVGARGLLGVGFVLLWGTRERMGIEPTGSVVHTPRQF